MIKTATDLTIEDVRAFCKVGTSTKDIVGFYAVLFVIYSAGVIAFAVHGMETYALVIMIAVQVIIAAMCLCLWYTVKKNEPQKELERLQEKYGKGTMYCEFGESKLTVSNDAKDNRLKIAMDYRDIKKIIETDEYFFIISGTHDDRFIVKKNSITEGTAQQLHDLLYKRVQDKMKVLA